MRVEKKRLTDFDDKEKNIVDIDSGHQNSWYLCQMISFDERSSTYVFGFTLRVTKKLDLSSEKLWISGCF